MKSLSELISEATYSYSSLPAIKIGSRLISYDELNKKALVVASALKGVGANGVSTRVHNTPSFMADSTKSSSSFSPDFGTPNMSSSYSSSYSPY